MTRAMLCLGLLLSFVLGSQPVSAQSNIDPADKFGWGENIGWTNWFDANGGVDGVFVDSTFLSGFVWCENVGWLNLGDGTPGGGTSYANVNGSDFGVNIATDGTLSGFGWGENIGWVNFDTTSLGSSRARFDAPAGRFRGFAWGENVGWISLDDSTSFVGVDLPAPANDDCANAVVICNGTTAGTLIAATNDGAGGCGSAGTAADVWYSYTATCNGTLMVNTCGTHDGPGTDAGIDTVLSVHSACPGVAGNAVACNDDWPSSSDPMACTGGDTGVFRDSAVALPVLSGETFLIRVTTFGGSTTGPFTLNVDCFTPPPPNDDCANAIVAVDGTLTGTLEGATNDGATSCGVGSGSSPDVWYSYTATCTGTATFSTCGTHDGPGVDLGVDTVLSVHAACAGTAANQLGCNDDSGGCASDTSVIRDSVVTLSMDVGDNVLIRVSNYNNGATGPITLNIECVQAAPQFQRGDCNNDGTKNIADPVRLLTFLFPAAPPPAALDCNDSCDANDDGGLNIADAVAMLNVLFPSATPPPTWLAPDLCGADPTADGLDCLGYSHCP
ncbi:MAG: hypothetical protein AAF581_14820 [Planctomycetota bacterium]